MHSVGARLRDVCFVHWPVDPDVLGTRLPRPLSVATREGTGWVSLLGHRTRPTVGPLALPREFAQVTIRTYVRAGDEEAVHFLRVGVNSRLAARVARSIFGVPFGHVDASVTATDAGVRGAAADVTAANEGDATAEESVRVRTCVPGGRPLFDATFDRTGETAAVSGDSLVGWLTERSTYALDDGRTGEVDHGAWTVARTAAAVRTDEVLSSEGLAAPTGEPLFCYSPGAEFGLRSWPNRSPEGGGSA